MKENKECAPHGQECALGAPTREKETPAGQRAGRWASWPGLAAGLGSYAWLVGPRPGPHSGANWAEILKSKAWALSPKDKT